MSLFVPFAWVLKLNISYGFLFSGDRLFVGRLLIKMTLGFSVLSSFALASFSPTCVYLGAVMYHCAW